MTIFTGRAALIGLILAGSVLTAANGAQATTGAPVTFGAAAQTLTDPCEADTKLCASSDPAVSLAWSSPVSTAGCRFTLGIDWGAGKAPQTVTLKGGAAGAVWRVAHTYAGSVAARHPYRIRAAATVVQDSQGRGCTIESKSVLFALTCTDDQLSGPAWNSRFPGGDHDVADLNSAFRPKVQAFTTALARAGVTVQPQSTYRSPQRSYLMHFSYLVANGQLAPQAVPAYVPVAGEQGPNVCWVHRNPAGRLDRTGSVTAARTLLTTMGVDPSLRTPPALHSRHNTGDAIDMKISWPASKVTVKDAAGTPVKITKGAHDGTNAALIAVGATYGVIHYAPVLTDRNHWSSDGH